MCTVCRQAIPMKLLQIKTKKAKTTRKNIIKPKWFVYQANVLFSTLEVFFLLLVNCTKPQIVGRQRGGDADQKQNCQKRFFNKWMELVFYSIYLFWPHESIQLNRKSQKEKVKTIFYFYFILCSLAFPFRFENFSLGAFTTTQK